MFQYYNSYSILQYIKYVSKISMNFKYISYLGRARDSCHTMCKFSDGFFGYRMSVTHLFATRRKLERIISRPPRTRVWWSWHRWKVLFSLFPMRPSSSKPESSGSRHDPLKFVPRYTQFCNVHYADYVLPHTDTVRVSRKLKIFQLNSNSFLSRWRLCFLEIHIPTHLIRFFTENRGEELRRVEERTNTFCFVASDDNGDERIVIFGEDSTFSVRVVETRIELVKKSVWKFAIGQRGMNPCYLPI